jgi:hypothetical protein
MCWYVSFQNTNKFPNSADYCKLVEASQAAGQGKRLLNKKKSQFRAAKQRM